jgi:hypothetical protein
VVRCLYSSVVEHPLRKRKVAGSIPAGGFTTVTSNSIVPTNDLHFLLALFGTWLCIGSITSYSGWLDVVSLPLLTVRCIPLLSRPPCRAGLFV